MTKPHKIVNGVPVPLTESDIAQRASDEKAYAVDAPMRALLKIEGASGMDRGEREMAIKILTPEATRRKRAEEAEELIISLGIRK